MRFERKKKKRRKRKNGRALDPCLSVPFFFFSLLLLLFVNFGFCFFFFFLLFLFWSSCWCLIFSTEAVQFKPSFMAIHDTRRRSRMFRRALLPFLLSFFFFLICSLQHWRSVCLLFFFLFSVCLFISVNRGRGGRGGGGTGCYK